MLVAISLLIQLALFAVMVFTFSEHIQNFYWVCILMSIAAALAIVGSRMEPAYKIAWLLVILPFPVFGGIFYLFIGGGRVSNRRQRRMQGILGQSFKALEPDFKADDLLPLGGEAATQATYLEQRAACPAYTNTVAEYFSLGDLAFPRMLAELEKAQRYIFLEYFIIQPGVFWDSILAVLERKAAQGVEVRLLYDDMGCMFTLPRHYDQQMMARGIQCRVFNPIVPVLNVFMNNRDHRKITVIDGQVGYTGGYNLADEYFNLTHPYGRWKDSGVRLEGDAVRNLTLIFLEMWGTTQKEMPAIEPYLPAIRYTAREAATVLPYADNPLDDKRVGEDVYLNFINSAQRYVYITTPYLILSDEMQRALVLAAQRGVDVRIITPGIPDKKLIFSVTRSYYARLAAGGVQIYEYTPGFIHAKQFVADDKAAAVGTINLDYRSLYLHFENGCWFCGCQAVQDVRADFEALFPQCENVTPQYSGQRSLALRGVQCVFRLFSPLM